MNEQIKLTEKQQIFFSSLKNFAIDPSKVDHSEMKRVSAELDIRCPWSLVMPYEVTKNVFDCSDIFKVLEGQVVNFKEIISIEKKHKESKEIIEKIINPDVKKAEEQVQEIVQELNEKYKLSLVNEDSPEGYYIPKINNSFVPFGGMPVTQKIIKSGKFCPVYIFGETGLGKSLSVMQISSRLGKEVLRINVNAQTCEEDLIGSFRLINGETVWQDGPLVIAMKRGSILLIDEVTALNPAYAFMLFTALEGEPIYLKKINKIVEPAPGFNIIATDNTKGYGTSSGRYVGVNVQNEAFLDRFTIAIEYDYPKATEELKILKSFGDDETIMKELIKWANFVRSTYKEGAIDVTISPRRLVNIMKINEIFCDLKTSIKYSISRFEEDVIESLLDFFDKIVSDPNYSQDDPFNNEVKFS